MFYFCIDVSREASLRNVSVTVTDGYLFLQTGIQFDHLLKFNFDAPPFEQPAATSSSSQQRENSRDLGHGGQISARLAHFLLLVPRDESENDKH